MPWINCKEVADDIMNEAKTLLKDTDANLTIICVGNDPASEVYVRNKAKACAEIGIGCTVQHLPANITQSVLNDHIIEASIDDRVTGVILQLPLPTHLDEKEAVKHICFGKDVDGLRGFGDVTPCTPLGIMRIINATYFGGLGGLNAVVIGRSNLVGKPLARLLTNADCTVTLCHSRTRDLKMYTLNADIVVVAAGVPGLLTPDMVKDNTIVIDVGINRIDAKLVGDVAPGVEEKAWVTPVPGGVGKTTVASLMLNLGYLYEEQCKIDA